MKRILFLCLMTLFSLSMFAEGESMMCLIVMGTNGDEFNFAFKERPLMTYGKETLTIKGTEYTISDMPIDNVEMCYFSNAIPTVADGIESINTLDGSSTEFTDGKVFVRGLNVGSQVAVYTADGQMVDSAVASQDGNVCVDLGSLKGGQVYILHTPSTSFKIIK